MKLFPNFTRHHLITHTNTAYLHCLRGAICIKSNSLSYESWLILSIEPYLLTFHCKFKVKEFFLETCPSDKYGDTYFLEKILPLEVQQLTSLNIFKGNY